MQKKNTTTSEALPTQRLELDQHQENVLLPLNGKSYVEQGGEFFEILSRNDKKHTRYVDADERPYDHSHDGNGWTEWVRGYEAKEQAVAGETKEKLLYLKEFRYAQSAFAESYLDSLSKEERVSRVEAQIKADRAAKAGQSLIIVKTSPVTWDVLPQPSYRQTAEGKHLMTQQAGYWLDAVDGSEWHLDKGQWAAGQGQDTPAEDDGEDWETL